MDIRKQIAELSDKVRREIPLVHNITNYVTVNDCANAILAVGGSPIMADDLKEVCDVTQVSKALVLNIGTLNERTISSMLVAGRKANEQGVPVVFDPVGAGATAFRNETARRILKEVKISVLRGNLSEIAYLAGFQASTKGVDASSTECMDTETVAKKAAEQFTCTVAITGAVDVITDGKRFAKISNGTEKMSKVTGTGCMTSAITGAFHGSTEDSFLSAVSAIAFMGMAGEVSFALNKTKGIGSFHIGIIDALSRMDAATIEEMAKIEEF